MRPFDRFLESQRASKKSERTLETQIESHKRLWRFLGEPIDELKITAEQLKEYTEYLYEENLKPNTRRKLLGNLKTFYEYAQKQNWILFNPMRKIKLPAQRFEVPKVLSIEQMKTLLSLPDLNTALGLRDRAMLELMYSSGLRRSELIALTPLCFSEKYRCIRFIGKGKKESVLPVSKLAAHFIEYYIENVLPNLPRKINNCVFTSLLSGAALNSKYIYQRVVAYGKEANFNFSISPHTFRYSIATHLAEQGADVRMIQEFLRHDNPRTTTRYIAQGFKQLQSVHTETHPRSH